MSTDTITKPIEITLEAYVEATRKAVEEKGADYVYPRIPRQVIEEGEYEEYETCTYVRDGQPSCLVGHALFSLGVPLEELEEPDQAPGGTGAYAALRDLIMRGVIAYPGEVIQKIQAYASESQSQQDIGKTWGEAVSLADKVVAA